MHDWQTIPVVILMCDYIITKDLSRRGCTAIWQHQMLIGGIVVVSHNTPGRDLILFKPVVFILGHSIFHQVFIHHHPDWISISKVKRQKALLIKKISGSHY